MPKYVYEEFNRRETEAIEKLLSDEEKWVEESGAFRDLIQQEAEKIRLGNDMKGKCSICKQFSILSRITN